MKIAEKFIKAWEFSFSPTLLPLFHMRLFERRHIKNKHLPAIFLDVTRLFGLMVVKVITDRHNRIPLINGEYNSRVLLLHSWQVVSVEFAGFDVVY